MTDERKEYAIVGKVTIGTDEYRDLIEAVAEEKRRADKKHDDWYKEYRKAGDLEEKVKDLVPFKEYVVNNCHDSYKLWLINKDETEEEDF